MPAEAWINHRTIADNWHKCTIEIQSGGVYQPSIMCYHPCVVPPLMKRVQIYLTQEQVNALKNLANERVNFSEHVRRAIDEYLNATVTEHPMPVMSKISSPTKGQS